MLICVESLGQNIEVATGFGYGTSIKTPSLNLRALYKLRSGIDVGADFQFFLKSKASDEFVTFGVSRKDYSFVSRYVFEEFDLIGNVRFYPLLGASIINLKTTGESNFSDNPILQVENNNEVFLGLLAGVGGNYKLNRSITLFGEVKYHYSRESQTMFNAGILYVIGSPFSKGK